MSQYRSALGKPVDMTQLAAKNEKTRAVGNMKVNARGDTIDGNNRIIVPVTKKVGKAYERTVSNRAANLKDPNFTQENVAKADSTEELFDDFDSEEEAIEIEAIKAAELDGIQIKPASEAPDFVKPETNKKK